MAANDIETSIIENSQNPKKSPENGMIISIIVKANWW